MNIQQSDQQLTERHDEQPGGQTTQERTHQKTFSLLLIDDSPDVLNLNKTILEMEGYTVYTADGGAEGLSVLSSIEAPDLILLDMRMEDMSGPDFLAAFKSILPDLFDFVPVVFLTAMDDVPDSHAIGVIHKPIEIETFLSAVKYFLSLGIQGRNQKH